MERKVSSSLCDYVVGILVIVTLLTYFTGYHCTSCGSRQAPVRAEFTGHWW